MKDPLTEPNLQIKKAALTVADLWEKKLPLDTALDDLLEEVEVYRHVVKQVDRGKRIT